MPLPGTSNQRLNASTSAIKPSNFTRAPLPPASTRYDPAPPPDPIRLSLENSLKQYKPAPAPPPAPAPRSTRMYKPVLPPANLTSSRGGKGFDYNKYADMVKAVDATRQNAINRASQPVSNPANNSPSNEPLPSAKSSVNNGNARQPDLLSQSRYGNASVGMNFAEGIALSLGTDYVAANSLPHYPGYNPGHSDIEELANGLGNALKNVGNTASNAANSLKNIFDNLADPFKNHPRTNPKNGIPRPTPQRYAIDWRGVKFWSPNNRSEVQIACPLGQYQLGELHDGFGGLNYASPPGSTSEIYQEIIWENLRQDAQGHYSSTRGSTLCNPDTIEPDPSYLPPQIDLPVLTQPDGTTPDVSDYPPIFTEDDFKPQREANEQQAKQDEQNRQDAPDPELGRQAANQEAHTPDPDPWDRFVPTENPFPAPYPYPLDPPSETADPDQSPLDRLRETLDRLKEKIQEVSPAPTDTPRTETTINGVPVNSRRPSPPPIPTPTETPGTNVTINGVPETRLNPPLPDTRTNQPTTVKPPTQTRIDPTTGTTPPTEPPVPDTTPTPEKCKDPCVQGLHDKLDSKGTKSITIKVFKSCHREPVAGEAYGTNTIDFEEKSISVPGDEVEAYKALYDRLFALESIQCGDNVAIATIPEWWTLRGGSNVPQLAVLYAEVKSTGKLGKSRWTLHIPHYNKPKHYKPSLPKYRKGSWCGVLTLTDKTRIVVNAASKTEAQKAINKCKLLVPVALRSNSKGKALKPRIVENPEANLVELDVIPVRADFYSKGQQDSKPDWTINLRKK